MRHRGRRDARVADRPPVWQIVRGDETLTLGDPEKAGPVITDLFEKVQGIQYGELPDAHGWCVPIEV